MGAAAPALPAFEIAVAGRSATLLRREDVGIHAQAHRASRLTPLRAGFLEDAIESFALGGL